MRSGLRRLAYRSCEWSTGVSAGAVLLAGLAVAAAPTAAAADGDGCFAASAPTSGDGTAGDPYIISEPAHIMWLRDDTNSGELSKNFRQTASFSMAHAPAATCEWEDDVIGGRQSSGSVFSGVYDGGNHTIFDLAIEVTSDAGLYAGLFSNVDSTSAEIRNLTLDVAVSTAVVSVGTGGLVGLLNRGTLSNVHTTGSVTGRNLVGGLIGNVQSGGTITGSSSEMTVSVGTTASSSGTVGGLVGSNRGTIENSWASGSVGSLVLRNLTGGLVGYQSSTGSITNSYATGSVQGLDDTGGLIGRNDGTVSYSFATGDVSSTGTNIGGFVGEQSGGVITGSYSRGSVSGGTNAGGFIGAQTGGTITDSFWDTDTAGTSGAGTGTVTGISGKTSTQLQDISTYTALGWDIVEGWSASADWGICSAANNGYPFPAGLYTSNPCESGSSSSSGPPARFQFTFWLPDGRECTAIGPVTVVDGTQFTLPGVDADCRTMPGATVGGWTIPVDPGFTGAGSSALPFNPSHVVDVSSPQQFTVVPFEPVIELVFDSNVGADVTCFSNDVENTDAEQRVRYVWVPRELVSLARVPVQAACSPDGYTLTEWNTSPDGAGTAFAAGAGIPEGWADSLTNTHRLYAVWNRA